MVLTKYYRIDFCPDKILNTAIFAVRKFILLVAFELATSSMGNACALESPEK